MIILRPTFPGSVSGSKSATSGPSLAIAAASQLVGRAHVSIRNDAPDTRIRVGTLQTNLQRDGTPIEPGDTLSTHSTDSIYICSEGRPALYTITEAP